MDISKMFDENEKPLDNLISDGGFCGIFRTIGCIGDSLSSGEFESLDENKKKGFHDNFDYSWGQYIARATGSKVYNFSRGGMTAENYHNFANMNGFWWKESLDATNVCQANIIALGVNDINHALAKGEGLGSINDINLEDYSKNLNTFAGNYGKIIQRLREIEPKCRIFLMTIPKADRGDNFQELAEIHAKLIHQIANLFEFTYVIDLREYGVPYDEEFQKKFYLGTHMNPMGYILTAKIVMSYIDYIIRHNMDDFKQIGFIGKPYHNYGEKW